MSPGKLALFNCLPLCGWTPSPTVGTTRRLRRCAAGKRLWNTDGSTTTMLTTISCGIADTPTFSVINGKLYFIATDSNSFDQPHTGFYQSDGTAQGTPACSLM